MDNDLYNDLSEAYWDNDVRPFYGEVEHSVGGRLAPAVRRTGQRAGTVDQLWETRIEAGECPRGACSGSLDEEGYCSLCGFSLLAHRMRTRIVVREQAGDYLTTFPGALRLDEYAPADTTEEAA